MESWQAEWPLLQMSGVTPDEARRRLSVENADGYGGVDLSMLQGELDNDLVERLLAFCGSITSPGGAVLRLAHSDLGSGTDCEQRLFDLKSEQAICEGEKTFHEKKRSESSKEKDFAVAAGKRNKAQERIDKAAARIRAIADELVQLEQCKMRTPWYTLFSKLEQVENSISHLDVSDCGLHATAADRLVQSILEIEGRGGQQLRWVALDGNNLGDQGMGFFAGLLRISNAIEALQLRNVGVTARGFSEVVAGLVGNQSLALLDLRCNGLCPTDAAKAVVDGVQRFNAKVEVLLE